MGEPNCQKCACISSPACGTHRPTNPDLPPAKCFETTQLSVALAGSARLEVDSLPSAGAGLLGQGLPGAAGALLFIPTEGTEGSGML